MTTRPPLPPGAVLVPEDLVELVGASRIRQLHAAIARKLKGLPPRGGTVIAELEAAHGGLVVSARVGDREPPL